MELPRLAAKQKRYSDISRFLDTEDVDPLTKPKLVKTLEEYRRALTTSWKNQGTTPQDETVLLSLERQLDALFNDARLRTMRP